MKLSLRLELSAYVHHGSVKSKWVIREQNRNKTHEHEQKSNLDKICDVQFREWIKLSLRLSEIVWPLQLHQSTKFKWVIEAQMQQGLIVWKKREKINVFNELFEMNSFALSYFFLFFIYGYKSSQNIFPYMAPQQIVMET